MILRIVFAFALLVTPAYSQTIYITPSKVGTAAPGQIPGTATNDAASAGNIGEVISQNVLQGSAISLTTGTSKTIASITLTPGDWDIHAHLAFNPGATSTFTRLEGGISQTTDTLPANFAIQSQPRSAYNTASNTPNAILAMDFVGNIAVSSNTTIFMVANAVFGTSTFTGFGNLWARRAR